MKFCIVAFITLAVAIPPVPSPNPMQDQSPAVLETNLRANLKIKPEMPKKNKQEWAFILRKPWKKFLPEPCRLAGVHCHDNRDCCSQLCLHAIREGDRHRTWQCEPIDTN
ncbi:hypothetical protein E4U19_005273 [Claviceps sp. Clav32 group G5]|nr:hypothetical protein E4U19_005273 [Claviceps sp. Clav32 group G5]